MTLQTGKITLNDVAKITKGTVLGNPEFLIESLASTPKLASERQLALVFPVKASKALKLIQESESKVFLVSLDIESDGEFQQYINRRPELSYVLVKRPRYALKQIIHLFARARHYPKPGISPQAFIDSSAEIDATVSVGPFVYIGPHSKVAAGTVIKSHSSIGSHVTIGRDSLIYSGVVIEDYSTVGNRVIIHANTVIGSDGYSYVTEEPSNLEKLQRGDFNFNMGRQIQEKILSAGSVLIEDDVEIGANTVIDRGTIGATHIGEGTKIDNLCQIAHNVEIGKDCLIIANTGIAGSSKIQDRVVMAGGSGCADGVEIGHDVVVGAYCAVNSSLDPFLPVLGIPAMPYGEFMKRQKALARLPKQQEEIRKLKLRVDELGKNKQSD
jgi:UDP-3-O-[3-hydroxymyristoyl] glucosamine N-acyltransferase